MKITSTVFSPETKISFPLLVKNVHSGFVVLFTSNGVGTVVVPDKHSRYGLGEHSTTWVQLDTSEWEILPRGTRVSLVIE